MDAKFSVRAVGGVRMIADVSRDSGRALATSGLWEWNAPKLQVIRAVLRRGDVFADVGANAGYYTVIGARSVAPIGHVYAVEPAPSAFRELERNVALNDLGETVTTLLAAAGAAEGYATLYGPPWGHDLTSSLRPRGGDGLETRVPVLPLHAVVADEHRDRLKLVKIDVEGHEDDVLRGLEPLLEHGCRPAILVEVHTAANSQAPVFIVEFCRRYGLKARLIVERPGDVGLAPADRRLVLGDLGDPPNFDHLPRDRYELLLEP
jgi:FkbM family methyltransferase